MRIRYWIRQPEGCYLHNACIEVSVTEQRERNKGESHIERLLFYMEPRDVKGAPREEYGSIRGVRFVDMSLDQTVGCRKGLSVRGVLKEMAKKNIRLYVSIIGTSADGRLITRRKGYGVNDILYGYGFLTIRLDELAHEWKRAKKPALKMKASKMEKMAFRHGTKNIGDGNRNGQCGDGDHLLFHEHFDVVYSVRENLKGAAKNRKRNKKIQSLYKAEPDYLYVFPPYVVAGRLYVFFRVMLEGFRKVQEKLKGIKVSLEKAFAKPLPERHLGKASSVDANRSLGTETSCDPVPPATDPLRGGPWADANAHDKDGVVFDDGNNAALRTAVVCLLIVVVVMAIIVACLVNRVLA